MAFVDATVLLFKCDKSKKSFGVRVEKTKTNDWIRTWAFPVDEMAEKNENYAAQQVSGTLDETSDYPGCPYCKSNGFVKCGTCHKISCWNIGVDDNVFTCQWCGVSGGVKTADSFDVSGNSF